MKKLFALVAAGSLIAGCGLNPGTLTTANNGPHFGAKRVLPKGAKEWTILLHVAADNNLYRFGLEDLNEMEAGINPDTTNVIVLFDGEPQGDSGVYEIKKDANGKNSTIVSTLTQDGLSFIPSSHEIDSGDPKLLTEFTKWAVNKYPAQHYGLAIWDHGSGIFRKGTYQPTEFIYKGFGWDDNGGHMNTSDLSTIVPAMANAAGQPIDFLGFDCCLMGHVELAYQVKGYCNYLLASEELEPGAGWDYAGWLSQIKPGASGADVPSACVDAYGKSYVPGGSQNPGGRQVDQTLSVADINALTSSLVPAINAFGDAMKAAGSDKATLSKVRSSTQSFYNSDCADIGHFAQLVSSSAASAPVKQAAAKVTAALHQTVIRETHTGKTTFASVANAQGLVIYFPTQGSSVNPAYNNPKQIAFAAESWKDFLKYFVQK